MCEAVPELDKEISRKEVKKAIKQLKSAKAADVTFHGVEHSLYSSRGNVSR